MIETDIYVKGLKGGKANSKLTEHLLSDGFVNKYDPEGDFIVIGCNEGQKLLYSIEENKFVHKINDPLEIPVTCLGWRPMKNSHSKVVGVGNTQGHFQYWHVPSMKKIFTVEEKQNSILCCDFSKTGQHFATAGKDANIRIYDQQTKTVSKILGAASWNNSGHSNRIFGLKFYDQNTIVSGGWDSVVHIWDIREGKSIHSFYGPHIAGDALDFKGFKILAGCYSAKQQIQLWDMRNLQQLEAISWKCDKHEVAYVYSACFSHKDDNTIVAGACGVNEVIIFSGQNKHEESIRFQKMKHGCFSVDSSYTSNQICFSTAKNGFHIFDYEI